jgi:hypothetical protein
MRHSGCTLGRQPQHAKADEEPVGRTAAAQAEGHPQRVGLRLRQLPEMFHQRRAHLLQRGEGELHLRLDARHLQHPEPLGPGGLRGVAEDGGLANAGLTADHQ